MTYPRAELIKRFCRDNTTAHREGPAPLRNIGCAYHHSHPPAGQDISRCRLRATSLWRADQASPLLPTCLRAGPLGVQRHTRVVSYRRRPPLHGRSAPCTSDQAKPDDFSIPREHKGLRAFSCRYISTINSHGMWHNICVYIRSETWTTRVQTATD